MKNLLLTAAAAVAVMSVAGVANAQTFTTGYVGGSFSTIDTGSGTGTSATDDATVIALRGVASMELSKDVEAQLDLDAASVDLGYRNSSTVTPWGPTVHTFIKGKDGNKVGFVLGYEDVEDDSVIAYGFEGLFAATDQFSLRGGVVWGSANTPGTTENYDVRSYRGETSYFLNDNARLDATFTSFRVSNSTSKESMISYGVGGEIAMSMAPVSITFGYERVQPDGNKNYNAFTVGARHSFGGTLKDRDRSSSPFPGLQGYLGGTGGTVMLSQSACSASSGCFSSGSGGGNNNP